MWIAYDGSYSGQSPIPRRSVTTSRPYGTLGSGSASTKDVADRLLVSPASVSNMFVRLQEMGLVEYERYQGASLTERGRLEALRLVRRHQLIEISARAPRLRLAGGARGGGAAGARRS